VLGDGSGCVDRDDRSAFLGESDRVATSLTATGTGDEGDLAVKGCHFDHPFLRRRRGAWI
jgi:hypothetical protein